MSKTEKKKGKGSSPVRSECQKEERYTEGRKEEGNNENEQYREVEETLACKVLSELKRQKDERGGRVQH